MHARTHACTVVRARGQTDRDKEHFRRCTGRPRSAYLLLLARRGRRTRGRVTPECPRFLLSVPSPSFSSCLSRCLPLYLPLAPSLSLSLLLRCSLYRGLVRPSSSFHGLLPLSPGYICAISSAFFPPPLFFFFFFFCLSFCLLALSFSRSSLPPFANAPLHLVSYSVSCEPTIEIGQRERFGGISSRRRLSIIWVGFVVEGLCVVHGDKNDVWRCWRWLVG